MGKGLTLGLCGLVVASCCWAYPDFEVGILTQSLENGKKRMDELTARSSLPSESSCWKLALEDLQVGCKMMTEEIQSRMALRFTSCFVEMMGLTPYMCESTMPIKECLKGLDNMGQATFREYFLHTQDMCYYLKQEMWQEQTNHAVTRLTDAAVDVTSQMYEQKFIQEQIFNSQQESLKVQSNLKKDNEDLYNVVVRVKDVFDDFSETAKEHQHISTEIFDKLSRMQKLVSWIQGEMSLLDMIFFYFGSMVFGYFATATTRTRAARFWLIVLFMLAIWGEKVFYKYLTESDYGHFLTPEDVQEYIWYLRKFAAAIGCFIVLVAGALYRDMQTVNNDMLLNMNFALEKVVQFVNDQAQKYGENLNLPSETTLPISAGGQSREEEESDVDDDTFSNYSTDESADNLEHELKVLSEEESDNTENVEPRNSGSFTAITRFFGKEPNKQIRTPVIGDRMRHGYNLRERSATPRENPLVYEESVTDFAKLVKKKKLPIAKSNPTPNINACFSSDDDEY